MVWKKISLLCFAVTLLGLSYSHAKVDSIKIEKRAIVLDGKEFGKYGPWELIEGTIYFSWDPSNPANRQITDIEYAVRNAEGNVTGRSKLVVLKPLRDELSEVALVEVSNRGGKFTPSYFNQATSNKMAADNQAWFGNGLTMRKGLTVIWIGWQFDVPGNGDNLTYNAPVAKYPDGSAITGLVRSDWVVDEFVNTLKLGHRDQIGYPVYDFQSEKNILTVRNGREAPRDTIPRSRWSFAKEINGEVVKDSFHIYMEDGFQEGRIYELVYQSSNPPVVGTGLAVIRDIISYAKYNNDALFNVKKGIAAGVSQTGRFLRHFLYQDFNTDEQFRKAYDGLMIMTAGAGRGSFNHRFAQPSRDAHRYSAFFYPTDIFPFTSKTQFDDEQWASDGLLAHMTKATHTPKTFYINTGYEYWGRASSLIHTTIAGNSDVLVPDNDRIYHIGSAQHFEDRFPPSEDKKLSETPVYRGNPLAFKVNYRALLVRLVEWVKDEKNPPSSVYPRINDETLVSLKEYSFPAIPGIEKPGNIHVAYRAEYGPRWKKGIIDIQPPVLGTKYPSMISQVNGVGNELEGIQNVEVRVPLATYTPWSVRTEFEGSPQELTDFRGNYIPFPLTKEEKRGNNDPRPSISELYRSKEEYLIKVKEASELLHKEGFLLEEDIPYVVNRNEQYWNWLHK